MGLNAKSPSAGKTTKGLNDQPAIGSPKWEAGYRSKWKFRRRENQRRVRNSETRERIRPPADAYNALQGFITAAAD
jgi:hypothetical protein